MTFPDIYISSSEGDIEGNQRGILAVALNTEPTLSFLVAHPHSGKSKNRFTLTLSILSIPNVPVKKNPQKTYFF
jgi:hypothetical protein